MHPMRVLFKIPKAPPPTLTEPGKWSADFIDFLARALVKDPNARPTAAELLQHPFCKDQSSLGPLRDLYRLAASEVTQVLEDLPAEELAVGWVCFVSLLFAWMVWVFSSAIPNNLLTHPLIWVFAGY
jgi:serine/threonine protein kinase